MKKLLTAAVALSLFAACKGKGTDSANTSTTTPATTTAASTTTTNDDPVAAHAKKIADCLCPHLIQIAAIAEKAETAPAEEREAFQKEIDAYPEPPCVAELDAQQRTMNLTEAQAQELENAIGAAVTGACGEAAKKIGM